MVCGIMFLRWAFAFTRSRAVVDCAKLRYLLRCIRMVVLIEEAIIELISAGPVRQGLSR